MIDCGDGDGDGVTTCFQSSSLDRIQCRWMANCVRQHAATCYCCAVSLYTHGRAGSAEAGEPNIATPQTANQQISIKANGSHDREIRKL